MAGIFVSYRRRDRPIATRFLVAKLDEHYGSDHVFHDLNDIDIGEHFLDRIKRALDESAVLLAVIGPDWLGNYREKLHRPDDPVRLEIGSALGKEVLVVPVLFSSARMPEPEELPEDLVELHYKNAVSLRSADLDADIERLIERLDRLPSLAEAAARQRGEQPDHRSPDPDPNSGPAGSGQRADHTVPMSQQPFTGATDESPVTFSLLEATSKRRLEFRGTQIQLTRELLDADNMAISSRAHALVEAIAKDWFIRDLSSNRATFVQVVEETPLEDGDWLIFGSAAFQFDALEASEDEDTTMTLDQLNRGHRATSGPGFRLVGFEGEPREYRGDQVLINRASLAPGNTSISRQEHARFNHRGGRWFLLDLSSNQASFIQARRRMMLCPGTALVLGGKLYTFDVA